MFTIGEFSRITGITVKALRFYHDEKLLIPTSVDLETGYRYYDGALIDRARAIVYLRDLDFTVEQIREILQSTTDEAQLLAAMERQKAAIEQRIRELRRRVKSLDEFIRNEWEVKAMSQEANFEVAEKTVDPLLIAGIRMKGCYGECGKGFGKICRSFGRFVAGPPMMLHYDREYKEKDADFEACVPLKQSSKTVEGITVREIPGGKCITLLHRGPYEQLGTSYAKITQYAKDKGYNVVTPTREIYLKGPGMIFKGNPKKYLTEIQFLIAN